MRVLPGSHDAESISEALLQDIKAYGLEKKICGITCDNASVNGAALKLLETKLGVEHFQAAWQHVR
jgi:hypothetical protein